MMRKRRTAAYKVIANSEGGAVEAAWEKGGRAKFNPCGRCGRWVTDVMYNADVHECVACAPWENLPHFQAVDRRRCGLGKALLIFR